MSDLGTEEREYLASFFAEKSPSEVDAKAALARVRQRVDRGADVVVLAEAPVAPPANSRPWVKLGIIGFAAAAAVFLFLQFDVQSIVLNQVEDGDQHEAVYGDAADPSVTGGEVVERTPEKKAVRSVVESPKVGPLPVPPEEEVAPVEEPPKKRAKKPKGADATLHAELALLRPAQRALRSGNHGRALALFNDHAKSFPKSALAEERALGRIEALCGLGRMDEARKALTSFDRRYPGSPLRHRAHKACESKGVGVP